MNLIDEANSHKLKLFQDPFTKKGVDRVTFEVATRPSMFRDNKKCRATIYFNNGHTSGNHDIFHDDFQDLVKLVDIFINNLT